MKIIGIIPARYDSARLPGKPLKLIKGVSMIKRVYDQAKKSKLLSAVYIATDNTEIFNHCKTFTNEVMMTSKNHKNGTERCAEVIGSLDEKFDFVINIQGDEPFISPSMLDELGEILKQEVEIATAVNILSAKEELINPNVVKCVISKSNKALYFSRNSIPFCRDFNQQIDCINFHTFYKHVGIYAYRTDVLKSIVKLPESNLESVERLEQLRWLENDFSIKVLITNYQTKGIDTEEDLKEANQ